MTKKKIKTHKYKPRLLKYNSATYGDKLWKSINKKIKSLIKQKGYSSKIIGSSSPFFIKDEISVTKHNAAKLVFTKMNSGSVVAESWERTPAGGYQKLNCNDELPFSFYSYHGISVTATGPRSPYKLLEWLTGVIEPVSSKSFLDFTDSQDLVEKLKLWIENRNRKKDKQYVLIRNLKPNDDITHEVLGKIEIPKGYGIKAFPCKGGIRITLIKRKYINIVKFDKQLFDKDLVISVKPCIKSTGHFGDPTSLIVVTARIRYMSHYQDYRSFSVLADFDIDSGEIRVDGKELDFQNKQEAISLIRRAIETHVSGPTQT